MMTSKTPLELTNRLVEKTDLDRICTLPLNTEELFHLFPKADYALTPDQLNRTMHERTANTVVLANGEVAAFANLNKTAKAAKVCKPSQLLKIQSG